MKNCMFYNYTILPSWALRRIDEVSIISYVIKSNLYKLYMQDLNINNYYDGSRGRDDS